MASETSQVSTFNCPQAGQHKATDRTGTNSFRPKHAHLGHANPDNITYADKEESKLDISPDSMPFPPKGATAPAQTRCAKTLHWS